MADQTVSLKLDADASDLKSEVREAGEAFEQLATTGTQAADNIEQSISGATSAWENHSGVINAGAAMMGTAGAASEAFARTQADTNAVLARTAIATGESVEALRDSAYEMSNHTFATSDAVAGMERLVQAGVNTRTEFEAILPKVDDLADATGRGLVESIDTTERLLRPFGESIRDVGENSDQMARLITQTDIPLGTLERNLGRIPDELRAMEFGLHDAAAGIEVFRDRGFSGQESVREFRRAVADSGGDFGQFLDVLGLTTDQWGAYLEAVEPMPGLTQELAAANNDQMTVMERLQQNLENLTVRYGGFADAASLLSPLLLGAGGTVFAINQVIAAKDRWGGAVRRLAPALGRGLGLAGVAVVATTAIDRLGRSVAEALHGAPSTVDDLTLALQGLATTGDVPDVVAGSLDNLGWALDRVLNPQFTDDWWGPLSSPQADIARESIERLDAALADAARSGNHETLAAGLAMLEEHAEALGVPMEELISSAFPQYARAAETVALASAEAGGDIGTLTGEFEGLELQIDDTISAHDRYLDAVRAAEDPVFRLDQAVQRLDDAHRNYTDTLDDNEASQRDVEKAAFDVMRALSDVEAAVIDGDLSFREFDRRLQMWVDQGKITADQADVIRGRVNELTGAAEDYTGDYQADFIANTAAASRTIDDYLRQLGQIPRRIETQIRAQAHIGGSLAGSQQGLPRRAQGGPVWPELGPVLVGEEGPELVVFDRPGMVHDARTTERVMAAPTQPAAQTVYRFERAPEAEEWHQVRRHELRRRATEAAYT